MCSTDSEVALPAHITFLHLSLIPFLATDINRRVPRAAGHGVPLQWDGSSPGVMTIVFMCVTYVCDLCGWSWNGL